MNGEHFLLEFSLHIVDIFLLFYLGLVWEQSVQLYQLIK